MRYLLIIFLFLSQLASGQIINASQPYRPMVVLPINDSLLFDYATGANVGYSFRKLDRDYTGNCVRLRRSNDNAESDFGFLNGFLDTAAVKTWVSTNSAFIVTWYNQSDSSGVFGVRNMTQSVSTQQPRLVNAGVIERENGEVCAFFDGSNDFLRTPFNASAQLLFGYYVGRLNDAANTNVWLGYRNGLNGRVYHGTEFYGLGATIRNYTSNKANQYGLHDYDYTLFDAFFNGSCQIGSSTGSGSINATHLIMGAYDGNLDAQTANPDSWVLSYVVEWVNYPNATNKTTIRININTFYGIY